MDHSIGELARLGGVTVKTVRYYSDHGLLPSLRTAAGHRRYDAAEPRQLTDRVVHADTLTSPLRGDTSLVVREAPLGPGEGGREGGDQSAGDAD